MRGKPLNANITLTIGSEVLSK